MITRTIPYAQRLPRLSLQVGVGRVQFAEPPCLLLFSDDEVFSQDLGDAVCRTSRRLMRKRETVVTPETLRLLKPAAVLLDLDVQSAAAWDAADMLLQNATSPPLFLFTCRSDQADFKGAIEAGLLIDKCIPSDRLLELVDTILESPASAQRQRTAMQQLIIRWLKPCNLTTEAVALHRFWGINE